MAVEIEAKMKVDDLSVVRSRILECGGVRVGEFLERNVFFDTEDRALLAQDKGLRIRKNHNIHSGKENIVITFKGPRHHGPLKSRDETELEVQSFDDAIKLLEALRYVQILSFEKKRESWKLAKCKIELDELPFLGPFIEIEGPKEELVMKLREQLHLSTRPIVKTSYTALLMTYLQENGDSQRTIVFADDTGA